jgi:hypothetical protein
MCGTSSQNVWCYGNTSLHRRARVPKTGVSPCICYPLSHWLVLSLWCRIFAITFVVKFLCSFSRRHTFLHWFQLFDCRVLLNTVLLCSRYFTSHTMQRLSWQTARLWKRWVCNWLLSFLSLYHCLRRCIWSRQFRTSCVLEKLGADMADIIAQRVICTLQ